MICPQCRSAACFRSRRGGVLDFLGTVVGLRPWRCDTCDRRFYARRVAISFSTYAHCPRCGNFDLEPLPGGRVDQGTLVALKRLLGFPAYRCGPCRRRFFTIWPFRRIVPSLVAAGPEKQPADPTED